MSWTQTNGMPPSPRLTRLKSMNYDEFSALDPGLLRHPTKTIPRRHHQAAPGADASAFQGRPGARVALRHSPILPAACSPYSQENVFQSLPVDNTHTCIRCASGVHAPGISPARRVCGRFAGRWRSSTVTRLYRYTSYLARHAASRCNHVTHVTHLTCQRPGADG